MIKKLKLLILFKFLLVFSSCGGGGGISGNPPSIVYDYTEGQSSSLSQANSSILLDSESSLPYDGPSGNSNTVRGVLAGSQNASGSPYYSKRIQYITLSSGGNAQYFGDLTQPSLTSGAGVTQTRAVFLLGLIQPANTDVNTLEYISIASSGNAQDFGDLRGGSNRAHSRVISPVSDSHGGLGGF